MIPREQSPINLESWYTEEQAAEKLGISTRTLQRLVAEGKSSLYAAAPERRSRRRDGRKPETVYSPADVDQLVQLARTRVMPTQLSSLVDHPDNPAALVAVGGIEIPQPLAFALEVMGRVADAMSERRAGEVAHPKSYLTIPEAVEASGLSASLLRKLCRLGVIGFVDGGRYKIARAHLDNSDMMTQLARSWRRSAVAPASSEKEDAS